MPNPIPTFLLLIGIMRRNTSTPTAIDRPQNCYLHNPASLLSPTPSLLHHCTRLPVSMSPLSPLSLIYTDVIVCCLYPTPTLYAIPIIPHFYRASIVTPTTSLLRSSSHYIPPSRILRCRCLSAFSAHIFSSLYVVLHYNSRSALLRTIFLTLCSDPLNMPLSYILARFFSLYVMFSLCSDLSHFSPLAFTPLCSNMITPLSYVCSDLLSPYLIF